MLSSTIMRTCFRPAGAMLAALLLLSAPALAQSGGKWVRFGKGQLEVLLPPKLSAKEQADGDLEATFGAAGSHKLELHLVEGRADGGRGDTAEQFVEYYARQRNLPVHTNGEKAVVMEGAEARVAGKPYRIARWQIGFGKSLVVMTLTAPVQPTLDPALKEFLERDLQDVIKSVRRTARG